MKKRFLLWLLIPLACQNTHSSEPSNNNPDREMRNSGLNANRAASELPATDTLPGFTGKADLPDSLGSTYLDFGAVALILQGQFQKGKKGDTLVVQELPGKYFYQKLLRTEVLKPDYKLKVYLSVHESIQQLYPYSNEDPEQEDFETWKEQRQHWQAWTAFQYLDLSSGKYRIPLLNGGHNEDPPKRLFQSLKLQDTLIEYPGEMGGSKAEFLFIGKPAAYSIPEALLKLEVYDGELLKQEHYISLVFSYGC